MTIIYPELSTPESSEKPTTTASTTSTSSATSIIYVA
ncbi:hypothetical protein FHU23_004325 [Clostridium saccharobutylicum]|nr:hypothetical protein [Clostridium saccharobutylicum]MBA8792188.1 hypothetical protein [Clostridium saccharobutylicum]MBA8898933.1 hypothetical protein [Clostridium saccharobutylicum]MBA8983840.1 hypothetical protein [Clostridium saccharobutylicum]MBA8996416.1 hypothetical protein [Clostridium saccharobutylicum]